MCIHCEDEDLRRRIRKMEDERRREDTQKNEDARDTILKFVVLQDYKRIRRQNDIER